MVNWKCLWYNWGNCNFANKKGSYYMATKSTRSAKNKKNLMRDRSLGGFTIIEVVLVLAIAGLIFMMVFIALPQLQRAQRDTQRRQDLSRLQSAIQNFQGNNNGRIPGEKADDEGTCSTDEAGDIKPNEKNTYSNKTACRLIGVYLNNAGDSENKFKDPDGESYGLTIVKGVEGAEAEEYGSHMITFHSQARCNGETVTTSGAQKRDFAITYHLEGSGSYCLDNK